MPIVATGPSCFTHSCEFAYLNPSKTAQKKVFKKRIPNRSPQLWRQRKKHPLEMKIGGVPEEKHLERENAGERWTLEAQETLRALAVEEAHILSAMLSSLLAFFFSISLSLSLFSLSLPVFLVGSKAQKHQREEVVVPLSFIFDEWWPVKASS